MDPFVGTWELNPGKGRFDDNHRPRLGTMHWALEPDGTYVMTAEGTTEKGERCAERPQRFIPDGKAYPVPELRGLTCVTSRPDPNTIRAEVRRDDGSMAGEGSYVVAHDGRSMTATTAGFDTQLRRFEMVTVWERV